MAFRDGRVVRNALCPVPEGARVYNKVGSVVTTVADLGNETITVYYRRDRVSAVYQPVPDTTITPYRPTPVDNHKPPQVVQGWTLHEHHYF